MSSSPTVPTSTTSSSTSSPSPARSAGTALIACGALARPAQEIVARRGWPVTVHPLPPLLHNQPQLIAASVEQLASTLQRDHEQILVGYADCGTYGALDDVCARLGLRRLGGLHCYDVFGGADRMRRLFEEQPGTYVLTDFLALSFERTVIRELGLDRYPELRDDYFGSYTRMVWLVQEPSEELRELAQSAADRIGLPLVEIPTGHAGLERELAALLS